MPQQFTNDTDSLDRGESELVRLLGSGLQKNVGIHDVLAKIAPVVYTKMEYAEVSNHLLEILAVYEDGIAYKINESEWTKEFRYRIVNKLDASMVPKHSYGLYHETAKIYYWLQLKSDTKREGLGKNDEKQMERYEAAI